MGKHNPVCKRYDRWAAAGVWLRVAMLLGESAWTDDADEPEEVQLDSTSVKVDPTASTGRRLPGEKNKTPMHDVVSVDPAAA